jgi:hypothetical protein
MPPDIEAEPRSSHRAPLAQGLGVGPVEVREDARRLLRYDLYAKPWRPLADASCIEGRGHLLGRFVIRHFGW